MGNQLLLNDLDRKAAARERDDGDDSGFASSSTAPLLSVSPEITDSTPIDPNLDQPPTYENAVLNPPGGPDFGPVGTPGYQSNDPATSSNGPLLSKYSENLEVDKSTGAVTSYDPVVNSDPEALYAFLVEQNRIRPQPLVRMRGTHTEKSYRHNHNNGHNETHTRTIVDFDIRLDFSPYMILAGGQSGQCGVLKTVEPEDRAFRGGRFRTRARRGPHGPCLALPVEAERDVRSWVEEYCGSDASNKEFVMEKSCPGYDTALISRRLHDLVASTNYRGSVDITFPVMNSKVTVRPSNQFTRIRYNFWVRLFFYITFLWVLSWPVLFFITKRYNVIKSIWPMSYNTGDGGRQVILSEEDWFKTWRPAIRRALLGRREGFVTNQDLIEVENEAQGGRHFNTGSTLADRVLGNVLGFVDQYTAPEWGAESSDGGWH